MPRLVGKYAILTVDSSVRVMTTTKRQNFNISPEQEAEIALLKEIIDSPTTKDAILAAVRAFTVIVREIKEGRQIFLRTAQSGELSRLVIPEIEALKPPKYKYLIERQHSWKRQLFVKGRRLPAATVWADMAENAMSPEEAATAWDLPLEAIYECVAYSQEHQALLDMEDEEETRQLAERGIQIVATPAA